MTGVREVKHEVKLYPDSLSGRVSKRVDGAISLLSPAWAERRLASRRKSGFAEKQLSNLIERLGESWARPNINRDANWLATGKSIDSLLETDLEELQNRCAELYRTNNVAHAAVEGRVSNEVGQGIKVQSRIGEESGLSEEQFTSINESLEVQFNRWSDSGVDLSRSINISEFQRLANRSFAVFGEAIVVLSETPSDSGITLTCELISPERLGTPIEKLADDFCRLGVQYNKNGTIAGYWILKAHPGENTNWSHEQDFEFFPRFDSRGLPVVLHAYERMFVGQNRGIPWMAACMDRIKDLDDWFEAELIAKQVEACFGLIFTGGPKSSSPYDQASANAILGTRLEQLEPGMIHYASEDETVTTVDPTRPGATFAPFVEQSLRSIAAALNFPYEILAKNFFRTTFSSGQLAMLDGRHGFKARRQILIDGILVPLWGRFVDDAVFLDGAGGNITADYVLNRERYTKGIWVAPGWGFINPRDEVQAVADALDKDITTLNKVYSEMGEDADVQLRQRHEEKLREIRYAIEQRKLRWELEDEAGIPHEDEMQTSEPSNDSVDSPPREEVPQESEEQPAAGA